MKLIISVIFVILPICIYAELHSNVTILQPNRVIKYNPIRPIGFLKQDLQIYCTVGNPKHLENIFQSLVLHLMIDTDDFVQYDGESPETVENHYDNQRSIFSFNIFNNNKKTSINMDPFNQTCIGIETQQSYSIVLKLIQYDLSKAFLLTIGLIMFFVSKRLSETPLFYYICGVLLGITASFLVVVYFISKLLPKKPMMYGVMVGGWGLGLYFAQIVWENLHSLWIIYRTYAIYYIISTGFISFVICYRLGPPQNQRSKDCIKWGLQVCALFIIYSSSYFKDATIIINILTILFYYCPRNWMPDIGKFWRRKFPQKRKLLTLDEYYELGQETTRLELAKLQQECNTPKVKPWELMMKLNDPQRFASFVEGSPHITDSERTLHESSLLEYSDSELTDDYDDSDGDNYTANVNVRHNFVDDRADNINIDNGHVHVNYQVPPGDRYPAVIPNEPQQPTRPRKHTFGSIRY